MIDWAQKRRDCKTCLGTGTIRISRNEVRRCDCQPGTFVEIKEAAAQSTARDQSPAGESLTCSKC